jgi:hypothetical protein
MQALYKHPLSTSNHVAAAFSKKGGFSKGFADALDDVSDEGSECDGPPTADNTGSSGKEYTPMFGKEDLEQMKKVDISDIQNVSKDGFFEEIKSQKTGQSKFNLRLDNISDDGSDQELEEILMSAD